MPVARFTTLQHLHIKRSNLSCSKKLKHWSHSLGPVAYIHWSTISKCLQILFSETNFLKTLLFFFIANPDLLRLCQNFPRSILNLFLYMYTFGICWFVFIFHFFFYFLFQDIWYYVNKKKTLKGISNRAFSVSKITISWLRYIN